MTWIVGMTAASAAVCLAVLALAPVHADAVFFGILGPLAAVSVTWILVERVARQNPAGLTGLLMAGFVVKMVFFGLYVVGVVRLANVGWTAFAVSFAAAFISMYAVEALLLRRLVTRLT